MTKKLSMLIKKRLADIAKICAFDKQSEDLN